MFRFCFQNGAIVEPPEFKATKTACYLLISSRLIHHRLLFPPLLSSSLSTEAADSPMISPLAQISTDRGQITDKSKTLHKQARGKVQINNLLALLKFRVVRTLISQNIVPNSHLSLCT